MNITEKVCAPRPASERSHVWAARVYAVMLVVAIIATVVSGWPQ